MSTNRVEKNYYFHKANCLRTNLEVESAALVFCDPIDVDGNTLEQLREIYESEGQKICELLFERLPGGTIDSLIRHMLLKRASLFAVTF